MENNINLNTKQVFSFSWEKAKKNLLSFFVVLLAYIVLNAFAPNQNNGIMSSVLGFIGWLISFVGSIYLGVSVSYAILSIARGREVEMKDFFKWPVNGFKSLWAGIVSGIIIIGFMLFTYLPVVFLIVGGVATKNIAMVIIGAVISLLLICALVYVSARLYFVKFYALETGSWAMPSIKKSIEITKGKTARIIWLMFVSVGIIILGLIAIFIGLIWAIPTVMIAYAYIYTLLMPAHADTNSEITVQPQELNASSAPVIDDITNNSDI